MTTLAAIYDRLSERTFGRVAVERRDGDDFRLRALPREDIQLFVKRIDNTRMVRVVDTRDWFASVSMSAGVVAAAVMLILLLVPGGYSLLASRNMERLREERIQLNNELQMVRIKEAQLRSAKSLKTWEHRQFVEPAATAVVFAPPTQDAVAAVKVEGLTKNQ